ncbi:MAG: restriction endonuclease [Sphaerochaetaceae bacterium]
MVLDFKEIPRANGSGGDQDTFELFAREYLVSNGFSIESGPERGPDGGRDILAIETRQGKFTQSKFRWLVSCKHFAHSGSSVSETDEQNLHNRMKKFNANGFLAFYSTIISSGLSKFFDTCKNDFEVEILDNANIERELLSEQNRELLKRFFPESSKKWLEEHLKPTIFLDKYEPLSCEVCGKDLLVKDGQRDPSGIVSIMHSTYLLEPGQSGELIHHVYVACKGECDTIMERSYSNPKTISGWKDIKDLSIPSEYLRWIITILNGLQDGDKYLNESFSVLKLILIKLGQNTLREPTVTEKDRYEILRSIPFF